MTYIILLNWNNAADTIECLKSLLNIAAPRFRIIVCDNASTDSSYDSIRNWCDGTGLLSERTTDNGPVAWRHHSGTAASGCKDILLVSTGGNLGFAGGNNVGTKLALQQDDMTHVWILNNDTVVDSGALSSLLEVSQSDPLIGICGSRLVYFDRRQTIQALGGQFNKWLATTRHYGAGGDANELIDRDIVENEIDYVVGASMLVSRDFLLRAGLMSEDFFLYFEEIDWAIRAKKFGFRLGIAPDSVVYHKEGGTINRGHTERSLVSEYYYLRNRLTVTRKHFPYMLPAVWLSGWIIVLRRLFVRDKRRAIIALRVLFGH